LNTPHFILKFATLNSVCTVTLGLDLMAELVRTSPEGISQHATGSSLDAFFRMPFVANSSLVKQGHESPKIPGNPDGVQDADVHTMTRHSCQQQPRKLKKSKIINEHCNAQAVTPQPVGESPSGFGHCTCFRNSFEIRKVRRRPTPRLSFVGSEVAPT
jgi:hypothetical protein